MSRTAWRPRPDRGARRAVVGPVGAPRVPIGADAGRLFDRCGTAFRSARDVAAPDRGRSERSSPVLAGKRYPTERPAVERPGFLNRDWRSGFADSNPLWLGSGFVR